MLFGELFNLIIVEHVVLLAHTILNGVEPLTRLVGTRAVGQVTTGIKRHAKDGVARLDQRLKHTLVGLRT